MLRPLDPALADGIERVLAASRFAVRALAAEGEPAAQPDALRAALARLAARPWDAARIAGEYDTLLAGLADQSPLQQVALALRRLRRRLLLGVLTRDVAGLAPLAEVMAGVTALAQFAVQRALAVHAADLAAVHGVPHNAAGQPQDLLVVAMGKGGGGELNVSSDLDLIFIYDDAGHTRASAAADVRSLSNHEFFERLGRRLIGALSDLSADGFVFRIDMRLRPNGAAGPLAASSAMLEDYLVRHGREWERFAWLKARVISAAVFADAAGFAAQCRALEQLVQPFVYRKYLDFNAIAALRDLHALIRAQTRKKNARGVAGHASHDDNVKLGRGGIREIEFIAQTFQVIRGGRDARLRGRATLATLAMLGQLGLLAPGQCDMLAAAYDFLRRLEHALQYVDDAQTHVLPADATQRAAVAQLLRLPSAAALFERYHAQREAVAAAFDAIFLDPARAARAASTAPVGPLTAGLIEAALAAHGVPQPAVGAARLAAVLAGPRVAGGSEAARAGIERLLLRAIAQVAQAATHEGAAHDVGPAVVLQRFAQLLEVIAGRSTYIALLEQYPPACDRVLRLLTASQWAADYLTRHPILLDELLDERLADLDESTPLDFGAWRADLQAHLAALHDDAERQMNLVRDMHHAQMFRLLVADLDGRLGLERLADHLSLLADVTLAVVLDLVWAALPRRHAPVHRFAVIGYGKLGGKELGYASDLDLVLVHDDEHPDAAQTYATLARRLLLWLTTRTSSGTLFEVDLRLRPNGDAGLLVAPWAAFEQYQRNADGHGAWTWEHQALTRARFICGAAAIAPRFEALRAAVLARPREPDALRADVLAMRQKMLDGHPNRSELFDLKHDRGGMVDLEFIVQTLVLAHAHAQPRLGANLGNIALLKIAGELGLIEAPLAAACAAAYRHYRQVQHRLRLNGAEFARVPAAELAPQAAAVLQLWRSVFATDGPLRTPRRR